MKKTINLSSWLSMLCLSFAMAFAAPVQAQDDNFRPYKGICWGMFWDQEVTNMFADMLPVEYVRTGEFQYCFPNFVGCGKELVVNLVNESVDPGYYDIELEMEDGKYDDYGYFYPPFDAGDYKWSIMAPNNEIIGPIYQPRSYYYTDLEYIGLFYVRYPQQEFCYFDIKLQEDYYENVPRTYLDDEEKPDGVVEFERPAQIEDTYYNLEGRIAKANDKGIVIENGRKVIR